MDAQRPLDTSNYHSDACAHQKRPRTPTMDRAQCRPRTLPAYCLHAFAARPRIAPATLKKLIPILAAAAADGLCDRQSESLWKAGLVLHLALGCKAAL